MSETQVGENIHFWAATDVGRVRDHNEDNFLIDKNLNLFVVADGMGGHAAGEIASAVAVNSMRDVVQQNKDLIEAFREGSQIASANDVMNLLEHAVQKASVEIYGKAQREKEKRGMGTTLSALLVINDRGFIAHVGDSRIYLLRGGRVIQLTEDHSLINELIKRGKLTKEDAEESDYKNAVTRAVGVYESVEVDTIDFDVIPGDQFLLASDGLTGYLKDEEISPVLEEGEDVKSITEAFIDLANKRGGKDNITNIVVRMYDPEGKATTLTQEVNLKIDTLRNMPLFKYLTYKELVRIMNITQMVETKAGEPIIKEGDEGEELYIVLTGNVKVHKGETEIITLSDGSHFGEMALVDKAKRSADVTALEPSKLLKVARSDFFQIIRKEPALATKLLWSFVQVLSERLRATSEELSGARAEEEIEDLTEQLFDLSLEELEG
ncbi:MAG: Stp1/IreP family PP2C-type Ser/Thr phosphatase [Proteobacteria bacterium]|nr:Stp1/IreP family PP2C-type Ser/Thr phosphatase [Pseudomonadota bacterium]